MKKSPTTENDMMRRSIMELEFHNKLKSEIIEKQEVIIANQKEHIRLLEANNQDLTTSLNELRNSTKFIFN